VIFDTPPVGAFVDAAVLSTLVDGVVMVVREDFVRREELQDAYAQLEKAGANVIGIAMNDCKAEQHNYYYYSYYKDDEGHKKRRSHSHNHDRDDEDSQSLPAMRGNGRSGRHGANE
jgi:Mrp family chromosome partitioning ATPase